VWNFNEVKRVEYRKNYVYRIVFDDRLSGDVDFEPLLGRGPVFEHLRDVDFFRRATIEGGTIAWPNGADIAPETLYEMVERANQSTHSDRPEPSASGVR
jgi:hypothetical protein